MVVGKVNTEGSTLRSRVVRQIASFGGVGTVALKEVPADGDLGGVVLVHASKASVAGT